MILIFTLDSCPLILFLHVPQTCVSSWGGLKLTMKNFICFHHQVQLLINIKLQIYRNFFTQSADIS